VACLSISFSVTKAYEDIHPEEDFSTRDENETFPEL